MTYQDLKLAFRSVRSSGNSSEVFKHLKWAQENGTENWPSCGSTSELDPSHLEVEVLAPFVTLACAVPCKQKCANSISESCFARHLIRRVLLSSLCYNIYRISLSFQTNNLWTPTFWMRTYEQLENAHLTWFESEKIGERAWWLNHKVFDLSWAQPRRPTVWLLRKGLGANKGR